MIEDKSTREVFRERYTRWLERLRKFEELDAPDPVKAQAAGQFFLFCVGLFQDTFTREVTRFLVTDLRQRVGVCQYCDSEVSPLVTHHPVCERCEAKIAEEAERWEERGDG
jgi:hypothetical protein